MHNMFHENADLGNPSSIFVTFLFMTVGRIFSAMIRHLVRANKVLNQ